MIGGSGNGARMAFLKSFGMGRRSDVLLYDPHKLSSPQVFLLTMVIFLVIVADALFSIAFSLLDL